MTKLNNDIQEFLNKCSASVGDLAHDTFSHNCFGRLFGKHPMTSPIEQMFYFAFELLIKINHNEYQI